MKKALVLLLALSVVGIAFAEDAKPALTFSGFINTGVLVEKVGDEDVTAELYGKDSGKITRVRINAAYTNGDFGLNFRLQSDDFTAPTFGRAFAWAKFLNGMIRLDAGKLGSSPYETADQGWQSLLGKTGMSVQVMPMEGLNIGMYIPLAAPSTNKVKLGYVRGDNGTIVTGTTGYNANRGDAYIYSDKTTTAKATFENTMKDLYFAAAYSLKSIGDFRAGLDLAPVEKKVEATAWFGFNLTAVENLTGIVEAVFTNLNNVAGYKDADDVTTDKLWIKALQKVAYKVDAFEPSLSVFEFYSTEKGAPIYFCFNPGVAYTLDKHVFGLDFDYYMSTKTDDAKASYGWDISPYAKFGLGDNKLKLGFIYQGGDLAGWSVNDDPLTDDTMKIYADFVWNF